ncbi:MAG: aminotransferase class IV, partial [Desulfobulbia bacterium]
HAKNGRGVNLITVRKTRIPPDAVDPRIKNYHWLDLIMGTIEALEKGGDLPLLLDSDGEVTEGAGYNIFMSEGEHIITPERGVLEGITRQTVFDICRSENINVGSGRISMEKLQGADEVLLTSTAGGIMPVDTVDFAPLPNRSPGRFTQLIIEKYWQWHESSRWTVEVKSILP